MLTIPPIFRNVPIDKKWSKATKRHVTQNVPEKGGIYELNSFGKLVYIGKHNKNLKSRLLDHLRQRNPNKYRFKTGGWLSSPSKLEEKHLDRYGNSVEEMPPWNTRDPRK